MGNIMLSHNGDYIRANLYDHDMQKFCHLLNEAGETKAFIV